MHEVLPITEGQWAGAIAFLTKTTDRIGYADIQGGGIIVFDVERKEVLWDWSVHGELGDGISIDPALDYRREGMLKNESWDWDHSNAIIMRVHENGDEEIWLSMRDQDWIVSIDTDTDRVLWRLGREGDFTGNVDTWFFQQHGPELHVIDGTPHVLLFDNGMFRAIGESRQSRVIELVLDEERMNVTLVAAIDGFYSPTGGDADLLPDGQHLQYLVGDGEDRYVAEVTWPEGEEIWRMSCDTEDPLYRAAYAPSIYDQRWAYDTE
jgi:hypothetical protein